jgi:hypothetical protein
VLHLAQVDIVGALVLLVIYCVLGFFQVRAKRRKRGRRETAQRCCARHGHSEAALQ